jgi:uncharacterized membrane protein
MAQVRSAIEEAFRWIGGTMTGLGLLPGGTYSYANGVSPTARWWSAW